jgi:hypothetical protein
LVDLFEKRIDFKCNLIVQRRMTVDGCASLHEVKRKKWLDFRNSTEQLLLGIIILKYYAYQYDIGFEVFRGVSTRFS